MSLGLLTGLTNLRKGDHPNKASSKSLLTLFWRTHSIQYENPIKKKPATQHDETEFVMIVSLVENPHIS